MILIIMQLDEHFSKPMKEFVSLCLRKNPAEVKTLFCVSTYAMIHFSALYVPTLHIWYAILFSILYVR